jgi:hypothetical protein
MGGFYLEKRYNRNPLLPVDMRTLLSPTSRVLVMTYMKEKPVDNAIRDLCNARGAWAKKIHGSEMQSKTVDWMICYRGMFIAVEAKAPGKDPDPLQRIELIDTRKAGGIAERVSNVEHLRAIFDCIDAGNKWTDTPL